MPTSQYWLELHTVATSQYWLELDTVATSQYWLELDTVSTSFLLRVSTQWPLHSTVYDLIQWPLLFYFLYLYTVATSQYWLELDSVHFFSTSCIYTVATSQYWLGLDTVATSFLLPVSLHSGHFTVLART